ncbi:hypothetical protein AHAS_Ahas15G0228400 [Arachis hypogaea]
MDGNLEQLRTHLGLPSIENEEQSVSKEKEEEVPESSETSIEKEVVEVYEPRISYPQRPLEITREHENSQPRQTSLNQRLSTLESVIEIYEEEMKKSMEEQQTSSMKVLLNQMLSAKEEVEEQESEEDNQERPYSSEAENCIKEGFIEPSIQKAFDKDNAPTITQPPSLEIK